MLTRLEEIKLLALCVATDNRDAFSRLVVAHQDGLRRFIYNLTGDHYLTDDIAQDTFIKAWLGIRSFQGLSGFKTWLYRIAVNEFVSYRRKTSNSTESYDLTAATTISTSDMHAATEAYIDVTALIKTLSDSERIVTLLFYLEDMPIKKIASVTSMPEGTIKSYLNRARNHMAAVIKKETYEK